MSMGDSLLNLAADLADSSQSQQLQSELIAFALGGRRLDAARQLRPNGVLLRGENPPRRQLQFAPPRLECKLNHGLQVGFDGRAGKWQELPPGYQRPPECQPELDEFAAFLTKALKG